MDILATWALGVKWQVNYVHTKHLDKSVNLGMVFLKTQNIQPIVADLVAIHDAMVTMAHLKLLSTPPMIVPQGELLPSSCNQVTLIGEFSYNSFFMHDFLSRSEICY